MTTSDSRESERHSVGPSETDDPDFREQARRAVAFVRRATRFWYVPLATLLVGGASCAAFFHFLHRPSFRSETVILHTEGIAPGDPTEQAVAPRSVAARVQEILTSRALLERVLTEFDLYPVTKRAYGPVDAIEELKRQVQLKAPGGSTFRISFDGDSPEQAQRVTARLAELVIDEDSALRKTQAHVTQDFLAAEKKGTEGRLREAEYELASFMAEHPRFALDTTPLTTGAAIRASVQGAAPTVRSGSSPQSPRAIAAPSQPSVATVASTAPTDAEATREALREKAAAAAALAAARASLLEKLDHFTPAHPDVRAAREAVALAEARLVAAAERVPVAPVPVPMVVPDTKPPSPSGVPHASVPAPAVAVRPVASGRDDVVGLEIQWATLTRSAIEARQHDDQVEAALFKADIAANSVSGDNSGTQMTVIDPAFLPRRALPPERAVIALVAGALSLLVGLLIALVCAALDDRIYGWRDAARLGDVLVEVPSARRGRRARVSP